jgi:hypothetical protein
MPYEGRWTNELRPGKWSESRKMSGQASADFHI